MLLKESSLTVKIEESSDSILDSKKKDLMNGINDAQPKKERPAWLIESTIYDENGSSNKMNGNLDGLSNGITTIKQEDDNSILNYFQSNGIETDQIKDSLAKEILEALLIYEKPDENSYQGSNGLTNSVNHFGNDFSTKLNGHHTTKHNQLNGHSTNSIPNESDHYEFFRFPMTHVNGKLVAINKVNEDSLKLMNQQEREEYVKLSSEVYHLLYD